MPFEEHDPQKSVLTGPDWIIPCPPVWVSAFIGSAWHQLPIDAKNQATHEVRVCQVRPDGSTRRFILDSSHYQPIPNP